MKENLVLNRIYTTPVRIILHLAFWSLFALSFTLTYNRYNSDATWAFVAKDMFVLLTIFYSTAYIIIPKWLLKGKFLLSFLWAVACYLWWATVSYFVCVWVYDNYELEGNLKGYVEMVRERGLRAIVTWENIPFYLLDFSFLVSLPIGLKLTQSFVYQRVKKIELERDNLNLELNFLKSQINPHFLFNSLNNIYRMVNKNDPRTADTVLALGNLMRYTLYDSNDAYVSLHNEINFIDNLMDLERLRYGSNVTIERNIQVDDSDIQIVPLILVPFIENAFKHGPERSQKAGWVRVDLETVDGLLTLTVANNVAKKTKSGEPGGVGISNAIKRLELNYNKNYWIDVLKTEDSYRVSLKIDLVWKRRNTPW